MRRYLARVHTTDGTSEQPVWVEADSAREAAARAVAEVAGDVRRVVVRRAVPCNCGECGGATNRLLAAVEFTAEQLGSVGS